MITLTTDDLKHLGLEAVKTNNIMTALSYIKMSCRDGYAQITKTNLKSFIVKTIPCVGEGELLVQESVLYNFLAHTDRPTLKIEAGKITAGNLVLEFPIEPVNLFPIVPVYPGFDMVEIDLTYARIVALLVDGEDVPRPTNHVFIGPKGTMGGDGFTMLYNSGAKALEPLALRGETLRAIPNKPVTYASGENYDYFFTDDAQYGFVKSEISYMDLTHIFAEIGSLPFSCNKKALISFNELAMSSSINAKSVAATWEQQTAGSIHLEMNDAAYKINIKDDMDVSGPAFDFTYLPAIMNKLLRALPYDTLNLTYNKNAAYITTEDGSISVVQELKK